MGVDNVTKDKDAISVKWIYKTKQDDNGNVQRLVARGFTQQPIIEFKETFTLVAQMDTTKTILSIVVHNKWHVYQVDVKYAFLNVYMEKELYVKQPRGYEVSGQEHKVYRLQK